MRTNAIVVIPLMHISSEHVLGKKHFQNNKLLFDDHSTSVHNKLYSAFPFSVRLCKHCELLVTGDLSML